MDKFELSLILANVRRGHYLDDKSLDIAIKHFSMLSNLLFPHGDIYRLIYLDVCKELDRLIDMKKARKKD